MKQYTFQMCTAVAVGFFVMIFPLSGLADEPAGVAKSENSVPPDASPRPDAFSEPVAQPVPVVYPEEFPAEWKTKTLRASDYREPGEGIRYYHYHFDDFVGDGKTPLSLYYVFIDWEKADVAFKIVQSGERLKPVQQMAQENDAILAVNGTYFIFSPPQPYFYLRVDGVTYKAESKKSETYCDGLSWSGAQMPLIKKFGGGKHADFDSFDNVFQGYLMAKDGKNAFQNRDKSKEKFDTPYTAIGINPEKKQVILFVVDGRLKGNSVGIPFFAIADFLLAVGAKDVLSNDGGGSSTMVLRNADGKHEVVNRPSDNRMFNHGGARAVQNALLLIPSDALNAKPGTKSEGKTQDASSDKIEH